MSERLFIAYLTSGLGNRLRPLAAALAYCDLTGRQLRMYWDSITPNGCLTPFDRLFENDIRVISLKEIEELGDRSVGLFTEKGSGHGVRREAQLFGRPQLLALSTNSAPQGCSALRLDDPNDVIVVYDNDFLDCVPREYSIKALRTLRPCADIVAKVLGWAESLNLNLQTKGVHARGTDFGLKDALDIYSNMIRERVAVDQGEMFFLSTEDQQLETGLRERFPAQVLSRNDRLYLQLNKGKMVWNDPDSYTITADHGVDALTDIYLLACVTLVVYHPASTFADISRCLHGVLSEPLMPALINYDSGSKLADVNRLFLERCSQLVPRTGASLEDYLSSVAFGPLYLEKMPSSFVYWETLGYRLPILERMIAGNNTTPTLIWDCDLFEAWLDGGLEGITDANFRSICPYPEARSQIGRLAGHISGSRILIIGSETFWLELLCCLYGAIEVTTVEYREIRWQGKRRSETPVNCISWDRFLVDLAIHDQAYDMILTYSSIEHSGLGRYGDGLMPLGDLYSFLLMSQCLAPHGFCAVGVPVGQDLTHFNAHRIYGNVRIRALEHISGMQYLGIASPDEEYLVNYESDSDLKGGWTLAALGKLPLGKLRQPILCFVWSGYSVERFIEGRTSYLSKSRLSRKFGDPHLIALEATAKAMGGERFVEITHIRPFGFHELDGKRINLSVGEALEAPAQPFVGIRHCVLHILLGCGVTVERFILALRWALAHFDFVHLLEHNAASDDWFSPEIRAEHCIENCLTLPELTTIAHLLSLTVSTPQLLTGLRSDDRNLLISLRGGKHIINYQEVDGFYAQMGLSREANGTASFQSWSDVYLGTAEAMSLVRRHVEKLTQSRGRYVGRKLYASCGGFFSLDQMVECSHQGFSEMVFFDINPSTITFASTIHALVKISRSRREFLEQYLLVSIEQDSDCRYIIDMSTTFESRLRRAARVGSLYREDIFNILRVLLFARLRSEGLDLWGMRNVGDNRIDVSSRLDIYAEQERFIDSNCLINGASSWLSNDESYALVRELLKATPIRYVTASIEELDLINEDLLLASNIFDFLSPEVRQGIVAEVF